MIPQLRVLELGAKYSAQKKNQKNTGWKPSDTSGNPLTADAISFLLGAVAGVSTQAIRQYASGRCTGLTLSTHK